MTESPRKMIWMHRWHHVAGIELFYSYVARMRLLAIPVTLHCKPKYCEPAAPHAHTATLQYFD